MDLTSYEEKKYKAKNWENWKSIIEFINFLLLKLQYFAIRNYKYIKI